MKFQEKLQKTKEWYYMHKREAVFAFIIFFVATLSFGLGYLSNREFSHAPIIIQKTGER